MDHLPLPEGVDSCEFQVPFLTISDVALDYEGEGFESLHEKHNFDCKSIDGSRTTEEIASFIQSWLYFGLLHAFFRRPVRREKFRDGEFISIRELQNLDGFKLYTIGDQSDSEEVTLDGREDKEEWERLVLLLNFAQYRRVELDKTYKDASEPIPLVLLSVRVLIDTLGTTLLGIEPLKFGSSYSRDVFNTKKRDDGMLSLAISCILEDARNSLSTMMWMLPDVESAATTRLISRRMAEKGWCRFQIRQVLDSFQSPVACYAAHVMRHEDDPHLAHEGCSEEACIAFNIDVATYKTRHVHELCRCECVSMPLYEMMSILEQGKIPLAVLKKNKRTGEITLGVKASTVHDTYVAFSHVWSDGLGNVEGNSLPKCQLLKIEEYIKSSARIQMQHNMFDTLTGTGLGNSIDLIRLSKETNTDLFWLDTLCIPASADPNDEDYNYMKELKRKAINSIGPTFASASRVIVLDSAIMHNMRSKGPDWIEIALRVVFSKWIGRAWTLEEGSISRLCQLQCMDRCFDLKRPHHLIDGRFSREKMSDPNEIRTLPFDDKYRWRVLKMLAGPLEDAMERVFFDKYHSEDVNVPDLDGTHDDKAVAHFIDCWNALSVRQTTRLSDRTMILSNLMDLNAFKISSYRPPMMALLRILPGVPLSLLYDIGPKYAEEGEGDVTSLGYNRWLPKYPSNFRLIPSTYMTWDREYLELTNRPPRTYIVMIKDVNLTTDDTAKFRFTKTNDGEEMECLYHVRFIRDGREFLLNGDVESSCLIFNQDDPIVGAGTSVSTIETLSGACLLVLSAEAQGNLPLENVNYADPLQFTRRNSDDEHEPTKVHISAVYDCPVRIVVTKVNREHFSTHELVPRLSMVPEWSLRLMHDCPTAPSLQPRVRSRQLGVVNMVFHSILQAPFTICHLLGSALLFYITFTSFFKVNWLGKFGFIIWLVFRGSANILSEVAGGRTASSVDIIATSIYAIANRNNLSKVDCWFIAFHYAGHFGSIFMNVAYMRVVAPSIYNEWISSYGPNPPDGKDLKWTRRATVLYNWAYRTKTRIAKRVLWKRIRERNKIRARLGLPTNDRV